MNQSTSLIALALTAVLIATFSTGALAQKTITFDQAVADMQADVTKHCGKGHNKKKFLLLTITAAVPHSSALKYSFSESGQSGRRLSECVDGEFAQHARPVGR